MNNHSGFLVFSKKIRQLLAKSAFFSQPIYSPEQIAADASLVVTAVLGWGLRPTTRQAREYAAQHGLPYWALEDGFLRSVGMGQGVPPLSIVVDDVGIYYDARRPSRLEQLIAMPLADDQAARAKALVQAWRSAKTSKYNHQRMTAADFAQPFVLVVDQTYGDAAIQYGSGSAAHFDAMLAAALAENPAQQVVVKIHPEVMSGRKRGHFDLAVLQANPRILVLADDIHPADLLPLAARVYVVTSQMGFDALLWGIPVRCFGMPFYAGWGLTQDEIPQISRRSHVSLLQLVHAALVAYPRYIDPETGQLCEVERVLAHLALQRRCRARLPESLVAYGFSRWKQPIVQRFCQGSSVSMWRWFSRQPAADTAIVAWGKKHDAQLADLPNPIIRIEDGFLRSVGLGAHLIAPMSWVFDRSGIYFDATQPSDLEHLLQTATLDRALQLRAKALRQRIVAAGLTKYNVGQSQGWQRPQAERVLLVAGQVEGDASIRFGAGEVCSNMGLLQAVRAANPDAYVVYKPHPDVLAGLRAQGLDEHAAEQWCDEVVEHIAVTDLFAQVDAVHVITSLTGFEALLRQVPVVVWGMPFYAGWGLTDDKMQCSRRTTRRNLDELVAAALILYPSYISRITGQYTSPEQVLNELMAWRDTPAARPRWWHKIRRQLMGLAQF
ncbi:capsular polysaccharide biosynthesis protein [Deefgea piscis]|uniref:Capsular polysaccharide biosynthesis protein n=1 Tax=Deefgea piscis TaxID=2739061 RepID=A0A6M8SLQ7_9NEIS|nr:capsular polysaccharide biosynthesis protein [Deefgea piscis]QKJ66122.1 capsular polysaccharide biosynthesis protein [Deefgea piscis]